MSKFHRLFVSMGAVVWALACGDDSSSTGDDTDASDTSDTSNDTQSADTTSGDENSAGEAPAAYAVCAACHGANGDGIDGLGPDIKHPVEDYSEWVVRNGRAGTTMVAFNTSALSDADLGEILDYLASQEQPMTGEGLFLDYCAACHGDDGKGGPTMRSITGEVDEAEELVRQGHAGDFSERREYMPKWSAAEISDAELDLIISHIESL